jgi:hypothetical protein
MEKISMQPEAKKEHWLSVNAQKLKDLIIIGVGVTYGVTILYQLAPEFYRQTVAGIQSGVVKHEASKTHATSSHLESASDGVVRMRIKQPDGSTKSVQTSIGEFDKSGARELLAEKQKFPVKK